MQVKFVFTLNTLQKPIHHKGAQAEVTHENERHRAIDDVAVSILPGGNILLFKEYLNLEVEAEDQGESHHTEAYLHQNRKVEEEEGIPSNVVHINCNVESLENVYTRAIANLLINHDFHNLDPEGEGHDLKYTNKLAKDVLQADEGTAPVTLPVQDCPRVVAPQPEAQAVQQD